MRDKQEDVAAAMDLWFGEEGALVYERYSRVLRSNRERMLWHRVLSESGRGRVLDVGTGTGFLSEIALDLGNEVVGFDRSPAMLEKAINKLTGRYGERFTAHVGDAQDIPFPDDSFDIVMSKAVLWTLPDPVSMLRHAARVLKPNGVLLLSDGTFKHLGTPVELFSRACQTITDLLIARRPFGADKGISGLGTVLPLLPREKVMEELRVLGATSIRYHDLVPCQSFLCRVISLYWHPYLLCVKF